MNNDLRHFTIKQLIIASGFARNLRRKEISRIAGCSEPYLTKCLRDAKFNKLVTTFELLPPDSDTEKYKGLGTIMMDIGRLIYRTGEKSNG